MNGLSAFALAFNERSLVPTERHNWDLYHARLFRYALSEAFYNNTAYREIETFSRVMRKQYALYKHVRGIYNPVYRQNELIKAKLAGGPMDWERLAKGALIVQQAESPLTEALIQVLKWSNWGTNKSLFVHQAALLGDVGLKIVDDQRRSKVRMEVLHPGKIKEADFDEVGNVKRVVIEYLRQWRDPDTGKIDEYVYTEIDDKNEFVTLKDGEEFDWAENGFNGRWPNDYGFVPLVIGKFKDLGQTWAANAFHAELTKINEVNDAASILNDAIRRNSNTPMLLAGIKPPSSTPKVPGTLANATATVDATAQRDNQAYIYADKEAKAYPLIIPVDIAAAGKNLQDMLMELERDMPELALHRLRESGGDQSGIAIRNAYSDATGRLTEAAGNLDDAVIRGLQMCVSIGGLRNYQNFQGFSLDSYQSGALDFYIKAREFFEDGFTPQDKIQNLRNLPDQPEQARLILEEMDYPQDRIDRLVNELLVKQQQNAMQQAIAPNGDMRIETPTRPALPAAAQGQPGDVDSEVQRILQELNAA